MIFILSIINYLDNRQQDKLIFRIVDEISDLLKFDLGQNELNSGYNEILNNLINLK